MANPSLSLNLNLTLETQQLQLTTPRTDYRNGNWMVRETLTLITAKRLDDEQCSVAVLSFSPIERSAEQRWKLIEKYCCTHGCVRSNDQCNNKWNNLFRTYKNVRNYESQIARSEAGTGANQKSYWEMERHERKEFKLPTNMDFEIHEALTNVLNCRNARWIPVLPTPVMTLPPPQPPIDFSPPPAMTQDVTQTEDSVAELEYSEEDEPEMKRRKVRDSGMRVAAHAVSMLSQTLMTFEEVEQRHRELLVLEERRLKLEEERSEMNRQAVSGLLTSVNGIFNAVHALVSEQMRTGEGVLCNLGIMPTFTNLKCYEL